MLGEKKFSLEDAEAAIGGPNPGRLRDYLKRGDIWLPANVDRIAEPSGRGRGAKTEISLFGILQAAVMLPLVDAGFQKQGASKIAAMVVWTPFTGTDGDNWAWVTETESTPAQNSKKPEFLRNIVFKEGTTWLAVGIHSHLRAKTATDNSGTIVFTDADPRFSSNNLTAVRSHFRRKKEVMVLLSINEIWERIADTLDLPADAIFEGLE